MRAVWPLKRNLDWNVRRHHPHEGHQTRKVIDRETRQEVTSRVYLLLRQVVHILGSQRHPRHTANETLHVKDFYPSISIQGQGEFLP
jgi:hypothetical protein